MTTARTIPNARESLSTRSTRNRLSLRSPLRRPSSALWLLCCLLALAACVPASEAPVYSRFQSVDAGGWRKGSKVVFAADSLPKVPFAADVDIAVRSTGAFRYNVLWLCVERFDGPKSVGCDTLRVDMAPKRKSVGAPATIPLADIRFTLARNLTLAPGWRYEISHIMPVRDLRGVNDIGLIINRSEAPNQR